MSNPPSKIHLGIYGICVQEGKVLLIKKNRGPYKGLLDLPGGRIEPGETLNQALKRELHEETNTEVTRHTPLCVSEYHCKWDSEGIEKAFHHIAIYNIVTLEGDIKEEPDGHDSDGAKWVTLPVSEKKVAPIALEALKLISDKI